MSDAVWSARAFCSLQTSNSEYGDGMRGAFVNVVCRAGSISHASHLIEAELLENALDLRGFEYLFDVNHMDREMSQHETRLVVNLELYPVQFDTVHYFKPDS